jgi:hypothetical protein
LTSVTVTTSVCSTLNPPLSVLHADLVRVFRFEVQFDRCPQLIAVDHERRVVVVPVTGDQL